MFGGGVDRDEGPSTLSSVLASTDVRAWVKYCGLQFRSYNRLKDELTAQCEGYSEAPSSEGKQALLEGRNALAKLVKENQALMDRTIDEYSEKHELYTASKDENDKPSPYLCDKYGGH